MPLVTSLLIIMIMCLQSYKMALEGSIEDLLRRLRTQNNPDRCIVVQDQSSGDGEAEVSPFS